VPHSVALTESFREARGAPIFAKTLNSPESRGVTSLHFALTLFA